MNLIERELDSSAPAGAAADGMTETTDILIIGTGFSGLIMARRIQREKLGAFLMLEKGADIGGTWRDNTYPGAACDIPSHLYSISFEPKSDWTRLFPGQAEIQAYLQDVARRNGLYAHTRFGQAMKSARWNEAEKRWHVIAADGRRYVAKIVISAIGALHIPAIPTLAGIEAFEGAVFHSATWDHSFDLAGKRVAVVGTGASAVQFVPEIVGKLERLTLFQRTAPWVLPKLDRPVGRKAKAFLGFAPARLAYRLWLFGVHEFRHRVFRGQKKMVELAEGMALRNLKRAVKDPALRETLTPDYRIGCKRILQSNDYFPALARDNAEVVTDGIAEVRPRSIVTCDGTERPVDAIIFGTGFHTTDSFAHLDIRGRDGVSLADLWSRGMAAHLGTAIAGFPNLFMLLGPNTGLGHNSVVLMIEAQADYVVRRLKDMQRQGLATIEARQEAQDGFAAEMEKRLSATVWQAGGCRSWYQDASGRNTTLWPGTVLEFQRRMRQAGIDDFRTEKAA